MSQFLAIVIVAGASFLLGLLARRSKDPLDHDPNKPFTSSELRRMGIQPPEDYEEWLKRYTRH